MPCPFQHEGEPPRSPDPRGPFDWIKDWYLRDINISRRVGWSGPTHDAFVYPFKAFDRALQEVIPRRRLDGLDAGGRMQAVLEAYVSGRSGVYPPSDAKGDTGVEGDANERPYKAYWPPVEDKTLPGVYPPSDPKGSGGAERPYDFYWPEVALAETIKPEVGYGPSLPGGTPGGFPRPPGTGVPWSPGNIGGGRNINMSEIFTQMKDLITPTPSSGSPFDDTVPQ